MKPNGHYTSYPVKAYQHRTLHQRGRKQHRAHLEVKPTEQRALELIVIAHPAFRAELCASAM